MSIVNLPLMHSISCDTTKQSKHIGTTSSEAFALDEITIFESDVAVQFRSCSNDVNNDTRDNLSIRIQLLLLLPECSRSPMPLYCSASDSLSQHLQAALADCDWQAVHQDF